MTLEQFQASRVRVADVGAAIGLDLGPDKQPGHVYADDLHIFDMPDGRYLLVIFRDQWVSADLAELELRLWQWASDESMFN